VVQGTFHSLFSKVLGHFWGQQNRTIHESSSKMINIPILTHLFELRGKKIKKNLLKNKQANDEKVTSRASYLMLTLVTA
jgi:hypothetical protein